jgi:chemotaxis response regulator CheB
MAASKISPVVLIVASLGGSDAISQVLRSAGEGDCARRLGPLILQLVEAREVSTVAP